MRIAIISSMNAPFRPAKKTIGTDTTDLFRRYPHLSGIELIWGTRECRIYLVTLLTDSRDGGRAGFEPAAARTIYRLLEEHDRVFPHLIEDFGSGRWHHGPW